MEVHDLPALNATLNALATVLLSAGYLFIRRRQIERHRFCMIGAFSVSCLFLASYLVYHYHVGSVPFTKHGWIRPVYFTILITHIVLAAAIVPLALVTLSRALNERFDNLAVRLGNGRRDLLDALPDVSRGARRGTIMQRGVYFTGNIVVDCLVRPVDELPEWGATAYVDSADLHLLSIA